MFQSSVLQMLRKRAESEPKGPGHRSSTRKEERKICVRVEEIQSRTQMNGSDCLDDKTIKEQQLLPLIEPVSYITLYSRGNYRQFVRECVVKIASVFV